MTFADLGLSPELLKAVEDAGYTTPTAIQAQAIPTVLMMKDLIGIAQTGTGKTASFVLPMIDVMAAGRRRACVACGRRGARDRAGSAEVLTKAWHELSGRDIWRLQANRFTRDQAVHSRRRKSCL